MSASRSVAALNDALGELLGYAQFLGLDVDVRMRLDGRVQFEFVNANGYVKHIIRADLLPGGTHPRPGEALAAFDPLTTFAPNGGPVG